MLFMFGGAFSQCDTRSSGSPPLQWCSGRPQKSKPAISSHHSITDSTANASETSPPISPSIISNCQSSSPSSHLSLSPSVCLSAGKPLKPPWHRAARVLQFYIISTGRPADEHGGRLSAVWEESGGFEEFWIPQPNSNSCRLFWFFN